MKTRHIGFAAAAAFAGIAALLTAPSLAQPQSQTSGTRAAPPAQDYVWPARITNARVLPADIGADRLRATMTGFSRALGVRCTFCHVGREGQPLSTFDFAPDARGHKEMARGMIRMTRRLNAEDLPAVIGGSATRQHVTCYTCHRGRIGPETDPPPPPRPAQPSAR